MTDETPRPKPPHDPRQPYPVWLPKPPDDDHDTAEAWADYSADLFRGRADWRMVRTAAEVSQAFAYVEAVHRA